MYVNLLYKGNQISFKHQQKIISKKIFKAKYLIINNSYFEVTN